MACLTSGSTPSRMAYQLPPSNPDATQDIALLSKYTPINCLDPFSNLISKLNDSSLSEVPPVTCNVSDGVMSFTLKAADQQLGIPEVLLWTTSACGLLGYMQYRQLVERGYTPICEVTRNHLFILLTVGFQF